MTAHNTASVGCPGHYRHWFRAYGHVGLVAPTCTRCGAPNPKITEAQRHEWDEFGPSRRVDREAGTQ